MTDDELRELFEQTMAELSPKLQDLRSELARVSELLDEARGTDTLDPRFAGLSNLVVGLMDVEIRALQLIDALARHALSNQQRTGSSAPSTPLFRRATTSRTTALARPRRCFVSSIRAAVRCRVRPSR
jgi:hypothetical protein